MTFLKRIPVLKWNKYVLTTIKKISSPHYAFLTRSKGKSKTFKKLLENQIFIRASKGLVKKFFLSRTLIFIEARELRRKSTPPKIFSR